MLDNATQNESANGHYEKNKTKLFLNVMHAPVNDKPNVTGLRTRQSYTHTHGRTRQSYTHTHGNIYLLL